MEILAEEEEGWWRGRRQNGQEGVFPSNFVQTVTEVEDADSKQEKVPDAPLPKKPPDRGGCGSGGGAYPRRLLSLSPTASDPSARQSMLGPKLLPGGFDPAQARSKLKSAGKPAPVGCPTGLVLHWI